MYSVTRGPCDGHIEILRVLNDYRCEDEPDAVRRGRPDVRALRQHAAFRETCHQAAQEHDPRENGAIVVVLDLDTKDHGPTRDAKTLHEKGSTVRRVDPDDVVDG